MLRDNGLTGAFRHQAFFYADEREFIDGTVSFIRDGLADDEPILVAVSGHKILRIKQRLNGAADDRVRFLDMAAFGQNPARIIPVWRDFVADHAGAGAIRGIGEPAWPGRDPEELAECDRHESLLNLAFDTDQEVEFTLMCPYDVHGLDPEVLAAARRNHPELISAEGRAESGDYVGPADAPDPFAGVLAAPPPEAERLAFGSSELSNVRRFIWAAAAAEGLGPARQSDLVTAVNELACNSIAYGGGRGSLSIWREPGALLCEVEDSGRFHDRLAGRRRPEPDQATGRGLWLVNQFCDLVQIRSGPNGSVVRTRLATA